MVSNLKYHLGAVAAAASSLQSCPTLCDLIDSSPPWKAMINQKKKKKRKSPKHNQDPSDLQYKNSTPPPMMNLCFSPIYYITID